MTAETSLNQSVIDEVIAQLDRPIVLVGLMGVGKSTVGRKLAATLGRDFVDADEEIEIAAQLSIAEIFEQFGEAYFRDGERRVIARLIEESTGIIATGGGAFVDEQTRAVILDKAVAVWIDADLDTLVERTSRRNTRPLLRGGNPRQILRDLKENRQKYYSQAPVRVISKNGPHMQTAQAIIEALAKWL